MAILIFYENNRHIFQELKNRIMGEKKHNLSGPIRYLAHFLGDTQPLGTRDACTEPESLVNFHCILWF